MHNLNEKDNARSFVQAADAISGNCFGKLINSYS